MAALPVRPACRLRRASLLGCAAALALGMAPALAAPPAVSLAGVLGKKALLVVDGRTMALAPGESTQGVRLLAVGREDAQVEVEGHRMLLQLGGTPVQVSAAGTSGRGTRIVLAGDSAGHFFTQGSINGQATRFFVDTGASQIAMGQDEAERLGLRYRDGQRTAVGTANGITQGWRIRLALVRIADVEVYDVEAMVTPQSMPFILLGNSFLNRFQMTRTSDEMVLTRRF